MTANELRAMRDRVIASIPEGKTDEERQFRDMAVVGITVVSELLLDIKRIADAAHSR